MSSHAGELLRIPLLDHGITGNEKYISLKEM
jgi:DNA repair protein RadC